MTKRPGLWENIRAKRARGGRPKKPGSKGAPTDAQFKAARRSSKKKRKKGGRNPFPLPKAFTG